MLFSLGIQGAADRGREDTKKAKECIVTMGSEVTK